MNHIDIERDGAEVALGPEDSVDRQVHVFEPATVAAINAAISAGRPLLVRGEPGTGKSQLARAAAVRLGHAFVSVVVDDQTQSRDLLFSIDSIRRLGEAQIAGALQAAIRSEDAIRERLDLKRFVNPGPLWWGLNWESAAEQARKSGSAEPDVEDAASSSSGVTVLIDEIDKAESETPNGLLEVLGSGRFMPPSQTRPVVAKGEFPLVVITTNGERALPDAFVRRCFVLALELPADPDALAIRLIERGRAHFPQASMTLLERAASLLVKDRAAAGDRRPRPGQAEYLDLLRAVLVQYAADEAARLAALDVISEFTLRKYVHLHD